MRLSRFMTLAPSITALLSVLPTAPVSAANMEMLWGPAKNQSQLQFFSLSYDKHKAKGLQLPQASTNNNSSNSLQFLKGFADPQLNLTHLRYNQYYHGIPVWGAQVIYHLSSNPNTNTMVTGKLATNLEADLKSVTHKIAADKALTIALNKYPKSLAANPQITEIIYVYEKSPNTAVPAYHILYGGDTTDGQPALHEFIINANTGKIIQYWNGLTTKQVGGTGPGGDLVSNLPYRVGNYQFGNFESGVNTLGVMNVDYDGVNTCTISNSQFTVINLKNKVINMEAKYTLPNTAYSYTCTPPNFINKDDNGYAPVNQGISPINDVTYFTQKTFDMYKNWYNVAYPVGSSKTSLPVRSYTHLGEYDNAFACDINCVKGRGYGGTTQIMVYGNGVSPPKGLFLPLTDVGTVGHELSHLVTNNFSDLIYANQSGGINEAFSDMAGLTLSSYLNSINSPFKIWNGPSPNAPAAWDIALEVSAENPPKAMRYFNNPPLDGHSIGNAANYRPGMDPHWSSGVFNKAFYLLSTTRGWTVEQAFRVMLDANMAYWIPSTNFDYAACGVIQSAANRGYNYQDVITAFKKVGVNCLVGIVE